MLKLYNFFSRKLEVFRSIDETVGLYTCGPTVYDYVHIGNWRTFVFEDVLKRTLEFDGYKVKHVMNLTDIDDKIITKAKKDKIHISELTNTYADAFFADLEKLNIIKADKYPRATKEIGAMIDLIKKLLANGSAYEKDGSVYFSISKFKDYGKLSGANIKGIKAGARVDVDEYEKDNPQDFALWKVEGDIAKKRSEAFDSPWGIGRPGWHIECSAMSMKNLGDPSTSRSTLRDKPSGADSKSSGRKLESFRTIDPFDKLRVDGRHSRTIDIHTGGVDLLFPHHENEIAQSESATGKKFVNYWLEGEHLLVEGEKMSKRLKNIFTLADIEKKGFEPLALRHLFFTAHYRSKLNFTWESLQASQNSLNHLRREVSMWDEPKIGRSDSLGPEFSGRTSESLQTRMSCSEFEGDFTKAVNNDLDIPTAVSVMRKMAKSDYPTHAKHKSLLKMDEVLGLGFARVIKAKLPSGAEELIEEREKMRGAGDFDGADKIREKLIKLGLVIEDTKEGPIWRLIHSTNSVQEK